MSKYAIAKDALNALVTSAQGEVAEEDALEAMLVLTIDAYAKKVGRKQAADALNYELSNLGGTVDTVFLRSR